MLSKALVILPLARRALLANAPAVSAVAKRLDHHGPPAGYKYPTMDDMLVPCGDWKQDYDNKQRKYNLHLLLGVGFFTITLLIAEFAGCFELYFRVPKKPLSREECAITCD